MARPKSIKTKIPFELHEPILEWFSLGMSKQAIVDRLQKEHQVTCNYRTLQRLLLHLTANKQAATDAAIARHVQSQVINDFDELNALYSELRNLTKQALNADNTLYLRTIDRLTKLLQLKFSLTLHEKDSGKVEELDHEVILNGLLEKLGK